jgi:hypothetical protein
LAGIAAVLHPFKEKSLLLLSSFSVKLNVHFLGTRKLKKKGVVLLIILHSFFFSIPHHLSFSETLGHISQWPMGFTNSNLHWA